MWNGRVGYIPDPGLLCAGMQDKGLPESLPPPPSLRLTILAKNYYF